MQKKPLDTDHCSFCGRSSTEAGLLITGLYASICEDCLTDASVVLEEMYGTTEKNEHVVRSETREEYKATRSAMTPAQIHEYLNQYVIGQ
ncbi:MAG TPA: ClpX C4-type zinc finger protein, partial [Bacteroidales bacterium]|nr:ClpX C4-type zinc finger protein [Bacteroidales bacterium]